MKHRELQARVLAAERRLAERLAESRGLVQSLRHDARAAVTPTRIVLGGLLAGFALGLAAPLKRVANAPRLLQIATGIIGFVNALRVQQAAEQAEVAAAQTEVAAADVSEASQRIDETV